MSDIALIGRARSGKDTVAARLIASHSFTRVAFADPLKEMALKINPIVDVEPYECDEVLYAEEERLSHLVRAVGWERAKDEYPEVRRILQQTGQAIRELDPDFWVRLALSTIGCVFTPVVVTDVRYPNEADALRAEGFRLVRIVRPGSPWLDHESETALDDYPVDALIINAGSLAELHMRADALLS